MAAPVFQSKFGGIQVAVWENIVKTADGDVPVQSFSIVKPYKKGDKWENGTSFKAGDIPYIIMALVEVFSWKYKRGVPSVDDTPAF